MYLAQGHNAVPPVSQTGHTPLYNTYSRGDCESQWLAELSLSKP